VKSKQDNFRIAAKHRLVTIDKTIADLARDIQRPRSTVSQAINHGRFPNVVRKVKEALAI
jgi:predicted transcriptional regulator